MKALNPAIIASLILALALGCSPAKQEEPVAEADAPAAEEAPTSDVVTFNSHIKPIFDSNCGFCHSSKTRQDGNLLMDTVDDLKKGGFSGSSIGDSGADSLLVKRMKAENGLGPMPPTGPAPSDEDIALIEAWIDAGALE